MTPYKILSSLVLVIFLSYKVTCRCNETMVCLTKDGKSGICMEGHCLSSINPITRQNLGFSITVKYPEEKIKEQNNKDMYLRGNGIGFDWNAGQKMAKVSKDIWQINIGYTSSDDGFRCVTCANMSPVVDKFQFRILIADKIDMICGNFAVKLPISKISPYFTKKPNFTVFPWFYTKTGSTVNSTVQSKEIGKTRAIVLYLPPSFHENTYKTYPRIFALDFTPSLPTELVKPSLDRLLVETGTTKEFILIGYGDYQPAFERFHLLTPTPGSSWMSCVNGSFGNNCDGCLPANYTADEYLSLMLKCGKRTPIKGYGDKVLDFLLNTVMPKTQEITHNRILTNQLNTGIMGYSLGGLMSCYAAWTRPTVFGMAACQSPSLWWPLNNATMTECDFDFINVTLKDPKLMQNRYPQKILIDAGSLEDADPFRLTQSVIDAGTKIAQTPYFDLDKNVWVNIYPDSIHSEINWGKRFWTALKTFLPSDGASKMPKITKQPKFTTNGVNSPPFG